MLDHSFTVDDKVSSLKIVVGSGTLWSDKLCIKSKSSDKFMSGSDVRAY